LYPAKLVTPALRNRPLSLAHRKSSYRCHSRSLPILRRLVVLNRALHHFVCVPAEIHLSASASGPAISVRSAAARPRRVSWSPSTRRMGRAAHWNELRWRASVTSPVVCRNERLLIDSFQGSLFQPRCRCARAIDFGVLQSARDGLSRNPIGERAPVPQVQDDRLQASHSRPANTLQDAPRGEKPPPKPRVPLPELFRAHPRRPEGHGGLAVVVTPVARQQPARPLEFLEDRRFRERRQDADRRAVEACPSCPFDFDTLLSPSTRERFPTGRCRGPDRRCPGDSEC